jgi:hypothetical protein
MRVADKVTDHHQEEKKKKKTKKAKKKNWGKNMKTKK